MLHARAILLIVAKATWLHWHYVVNMACHKLNKVHSQFPLFSSVELVASKGCISFCLSIDFTACLNAKVTLGPCRLLEYKVNITLSQHKCVLAYLCELCLSSSIHVLQPVKWFCYNPSTSTEYADRRIWFSIVRRRLRSPKNTTFLEANRPITSCKR